MNINDSGNNASNDNIDSSQIGQSSNDPTVVTKNSNANERRPCKINFILLFWCEHACMLITQLLFN